MNYTLQLHSNNRTYPVPRGLHDLMADIAREVLRHKPMQIEKFIYKYLDSLMRIKRVAKGVVPEVDKTISTAAKKTQMLYDLGLTSDQADAAASKLQALVRGHMARKQFKDLIDRKDSCKINYHDVSYVTSKILKKYNLTPTQANSICTKIQAAFRGWMVRKMAICNVPSHESWRHDWLWKEFQMSPSEVKAVTRTEKKSYVKGEELLFQPRRSIEIDHIKFMKAFKGELADYDDRSDTSSIGDTTPSEEETEGKQSELEEEKAVEEPKDFLPCCPRRVEVEEEVEEEILEESQKILTKSPSELSNESHSNTEVIKKLEEEKSLISDEVEIKGRASLSETEHSEENAPIHSEEQEDVMSDFEPLIAEEQEVDVTRNIDNIGPEEFEFYYENKLGEVDEMIQEEFIEEE
ncbi:probable inactive protein kinase DDB_G0270444 [Halyomorpha halys]|uniref:probable inactive protein kinase DDB_G0270444 n=1 Tax=Halyomorpha halys TaxID=286706 RepID=UPI000D0C8ADE|nr:uncharacterized protein LOC112211750 [Halyomorpha halys]